MSARKWTVEQRRAYSEKFRMENSPKYRGGRTISNGYVRILVGVGHHLANPKGYAYEHQLVAEQKLGRPLAKGEEVHHINENKLDNRPENLEVTAGRAAHAVRHRRVGKVQRLPGEPNPSIPCACGCGRQFSRYDREGRPRKFISGHNFAKHTT